MCSSCAGGTRKHAQTGDPHNHGRMCPGPGTVWGVGNTPISKNDDRPGARLEDIVVALGQEKRYCVVVLCAVHTKTHANQLGP